MSGPKTFKRKKLCQNDFISDSSDIEDGDKNSVDIWNRMNTNKTNAICSTEQERNVDKENVIMIDDDSNYCKSAQPDNLLYKSESSNWGFDAFPQSNILQTVTSKPCSQETVVAKVLSKKTAQEISDARRLAELKRTEKERIRIEKQSVKADKLAQKEKEKHMKNVIKETKAQFSLKDCLKFISVMVDPHIINDCGLGAAIYKACEDIGVCCLTESQTVPYSVTWRRQITQVNTEDISILSVKKNITEDEVLGVIPVTEFVEMVYAFKQRNDAADVKTTLTDYVKNVKEQYQGRQYTGVVQGMEQYFREQKTLKHRQHRKAVESLSNHEMASNRKIKKLKFSIEVSRVDVEEALTDVQLYTECNIRFVETGQDVADLVRTFTKAVAEKPAKKDRLTSVFSFHEEGTSGIKVDKSGQGLLKVWKHQLMQFKNVSPDIADALVAAYPSPRLLLNMYQNCLSEKEAIQLLSDIVVRRGAGVLGTTRRVGKETARRIFSFMTCREPNTVIK